MLKLARQILLAAVAVFALERLVGWLVAAADGQATEDLTWTNEDDQAANDAYWNLR